MTIEVVSTQFDLVSGSVVMPPPCDLTEPPDAELASGVVMALVSSNLIHDLNVEHVGRLALTFCNVEIRVRADGSLARIAAFTVDSEVTAADIAADRLLLTLRPLTLVEVRVESAECLPGGVEWTVGLAAVGVTWERAIRPGEVLHFLLPPGEYTAFLSNHPNETDFEISPGEAQRVVVVQM